MSDHSGIYKILNTVNGKVYVGSAISIVKRWYSHKYWLRAGIHYNKHLQASWHKYGESVFVFEVIVACLPTELVKKEQEWIDKLKAVSYTFGYNSKKNASSNLGMKMSPLTKLKMSIAQSKAIKINPQKGRPGNRKGCKHSDSARKKMSETKLKKREE